MPSAARTEGAAMIDRLLPQDVPPMSVTIASRQTHLGRGICFTIHWPSGHALGGEYQSTVIVPGQQGVLREAAEARLAQLATRHVQIQRMARLHLEELEACDYDPGTGQCVEDDMPTPAWRVHAPLALRKALDDAGIGGDERMDMLERSNAVTWRGAAIKIDDREEEDEVLNRRRALNGWPSMARWITRASIRTPKATWTQGKQRCYLRIAMTLPDTMLTALVGRSPAHIVDLPGLNAPGLTVVTAKNTAKGAEFDISRAFSLLGPLPGEAA